MTYKNALKYIHGANRTSGAPTLERMRLLCRYLGNPQDKMRYIHIAGTNGKGSAAAALSSILQVAGYKTGLFISPYINDFRERMSINGVLISPDLLAGFVKTVADAVTRMKADIEAKNMSANIPQSLLDGTISPDPVEFELVTAVGFLYFTHQECDIVVLECGLGGKYDATNVIPPPLLSIIMKIDFDHTELLGDNLADIAREKCGIIKRGTGAVIAYHTSSDEVSDVLTETCENLGCQLKMPNMSYATVLGNSPGGLRFKYRGRSYFSSLPALYQLANLCTVIEAANALGSLSLRISEADITKGLASTKFPARFELFGISPTVIVDGAHNADGISALACSVNSIFGSKDVKIHLLIGMLRDKSPADALQKFLLYTRNGGQGTLTIGKIATVSPQNPRAMPARELSRIVGDIFSGFCDSVDFYKNCYTAIESLLSEIDEHDVLICFGSLYMAGEVREAISDIFTQNLKP